MSVLKKIRFMFILVFACLLTGLTVSAALAASKPIANLTEFTGEVIIRTQGAYGTFPEIGMPLFSDDQIATRDGSATITFDDGAVLNIEANSNTLIEQIEKKEGTVEKVKRRFMLLLGKLRFKTGSLGSNTSLATPTAVCGLRGTAGTLSIGVDGTPMVSFTEGGRTQTLGELIDGVAENWPAETAEANPIQYATFMANAIADAKNTQDKAGKAGQLLPSYEKTLESAADTDEERAALKEKALSPAGQAALAAYWDARLTHQTVQTVLFIANNLSSKSPDGEIRNKYAAIAADAAKALEDAQIALTAAIDALSALGLPTPEDPAPFVEAGEQFGITDEVGPASPA